MPNTNPDKNEILTSSLKSTMDILRTLVTRKEYLEFSKTLMNFVVKVENRNSTEFDAQWKKIDSAIDALKENNKGDFDSLKAEILKTLSEVKNGVDGIDGKDGYTPVKGVDYFDGEDGKDLEPITPDILRDKLESLTGDNRLDKSAIKGLGEYATKKDLKELKPGMPTNNGVTVRTLAGTDGVTIDNTNPEFPKIGLASDSSGIFVLKSGDTMTGALIVPAHEATGLVPQVGNYGYCAIGDLPDVATVPEGTFFFILP
jgi:hypothetical protein